MWYVYVIECEDKSSYTGMTNNLVRRFQRHSTKDGGHYTKYKSAVKIILSEEFPNKFEAAKREKQIKGWTRAKKLALARQNLTLLKDL
ncbi:MAG: GIY-YIG nuclease family protein [Candidatus Omnitrophica bacterium]|nr:GIY-YIG nuclease family protein [Candidatus Omnitrophota bacterium]